MSFQPALITFHLPLFTFPISAFQRFSFSAFHLPSRFRIRAGVTDPRLQRTSASLLPISHLPSPRLPFHLPLLTFHFPLFCVSAFQLFISPPASAFAPGSQTRGYRELQRHCSPSPISHFCVSAFQHLSFFSPSPILACQPFSVSAFSPAPLPSPFSAFQLFLTPLSQDFHGIFV